MDDVKVPYRTFEYLLTGFVHGEAVDAGRRYAGGNVAHPGDPFGDVERALRAKMPEHFGGRTDL